MYISHKHKFIYFGPTKVASNAVALIFTKLFNAEKVKPSQSFNGYCTDHHSVFLPKEYKDYLLIASVRNPFERELSKYNYLISELHKNQYEKEKLYWLLDENDKLKEFSKYIDWVIDPTFKGVWHRQDAWKYSMTHQIFHNPVPHDCIPITKIDKVLKCENLKTDLISLEFIKNSNEIKSVFKMCDERYNVCSKQYAYFFPDACVERYLKAFKADFENFGYETKVPTHIREGLAKPSSPPNVKQTNFGGRTITYIPKNDYKQIKIL